MYVYLCFCIFLITRQEQFLPGSRVTSQLTKLSSKGWIRGADVIAFLATLISPAVMSNVLNFNMIFFFFFSFLFHFFGQVGQFQ